MKQEVQVAFELDASLSIEEIVELMRTVGEVTMIKEERHIYDTAEPGDYPWVA